MANRYDLSGRCAIVTGGAQGIGLAIVRRLLDSEARVAIWDRDGPLLERTVTGLEAGDRLIGDRVDVSRPDAVRDAADRLIRGWGSIDVLVNNAGISGPDIGLVDYPLEKWREVMSIDLDGVFHCCKYVVPHMVAAGYGRIVNVASIAGKEGNPNAGPYSAPRPESSRSPSRSARSSPDTISP